MSEERDLTFKMGVDGDQAVPTAFEQARVAAQKLGEETTKLKEKYKKLQEAGTASAEEVDAHRLAIIRSEEAQRSATDTAKALKDEFKKGGDEAKKAAPKVDLFSQRLTELGAAGTIVAGAITAIGAGIVLVANEVERRAAVFNRFGGDLTNLRQRTGGLVTELEAMEVANNLAQRGIEATGNDLNNILVAALERSSATGEDFNSVVDQLIEGVGSGSTEALGRFGLQATTTSEALEQLDENFSDVDSSADTAGGAFEVLGNTADDMGTRFLEAVEDSGELDLAFQEIFDTIAGGQGTFEDSLESMLSVAEVFGAGAAEAISRFSAGIQGDIEGMSALARAFVAFSSGDFEEAASLFGESAEAFGQGTFAQVAIGAQDAASGQLATNVNQRVRANAVARGARQGANRGAQRTGGGRRGTGGTRDAATDIGNIAGGGELQSRFDVEAGLDALSENAVERAREQAEEELRIFETRMDLEDRRRQEAMELQEALREQQIELIEKQKEAERLATRQLQEQTREYEEFTKPIVEGLTDALANLVAGSKTAEEAFAGLLSGFLEMIAQQTALQAAKEYAEAVAAFAREDFDSGALHLAAGVAFTGVAVAAGAASIAVAPPAAAGPSSPQQFQQGAGGGDSFTVNVNGPVLSSGSRSNLGREIGAIINEGNRRFLRAS